VINSKIRKDSRNIPQNIDPIIKTGTGTETETKVAVEVKDKRGIVGEDEGDWDSLGSCLHFFFLELFFVHL